MRDLNASKRLPADRQDDECRHIEAEPGPSLWDAEYTDLQVIPSTTRQMPSKALVLFSELLGFSSFHQVLDAGCGNGRNAVYLAEKGSEVDALDASEAALAELQLLARERHVEHRIRSQHAFLNKRFPFSSKHFDLALDSYVFCHFTDESLRLHYREEMARVLKPGGVLFSSVFSPEDAYYAQFLNRETSLARDPNNGITKRIYKEEDIKSFFATRFTIEYFAKFEFEDLVLGQRYGRSILVTILRR